MANNMTREGKKIEIEHRVPLLTVDILPHTQAAVASERYYVDNLGRSQDDSIPEQDTLVSNDESRLLTDVGRAAAHFLKYVGEVPRSATGISSPRLRAIQTADLVVGGEIVHPYPGSQDRIRKVKSTEKLNYHLGGDGEFKKGWSEAFGNGQVVEWLFEKSDELVERNADAVDFSFSRSAGNVAEMLKDVVIEQQQGDGNSQDRFVAATHRSIADTFFVAALKAKQGEAAAKKFVEGLPDKNGLMAPTHDEKTKQLYYGDGLKVQVDLVNDQPEIVLTYSMSRSRPGAEHVKIYETVRLNMAELDKIISQRDALDKKVVAKIKALVDEQVSNK